MIETKTRIVILRHHTERHLAHNTGKIAASTYSNCELHDYGEPGKPFKLPDLRDAMLLFPEGKPTERVLFPPKTLIVIDGTWPEVRAMRKRVPLSVRVLCLPKPLPTHFAIIDALRLIEP